MRTSRLLLNEPRPVRGYVDPIDFVGLQGFTVMV
jgi:hypothetical protein